MITISGIGELVLDVLDLGRAEHFYGTILGLPLRRIKPQVTWVETAQCRIQLKVHGEPGHRGALACHFAFSVTSSDIDEIAKTLNQHGLLDRGPIDFGNGARGVFVFDPDGNEVEFNDLYTRSRPDDDANGLPQVCSLIETIPIGH